MPQTMSAAEIRRAKRVAAVIGASLLGLLVAIEIALSFDDRPANTFSNIVRAWGIAGLAAPFGWGTLAGHFFHPFGTWTSIFSAWLGAVANLLVAIAPIALLAGIDIAVALATPGHVYPDWVSPLALLAGFVWGALAWPVGDPAA